MTGAPENIFRWKSLEIKANDERPPKTDCKKMLISNDHMIILMTDEVYTFHLKELYWSRYPLEKQRDMEAMSSNSCLARPGLLVDLDSKLVLKLLVFDTEEGNLNVFRFL